MQKTFLVLGLILILFSVSFAQDENKGKIVLKNGTEFTVRLKDKIDTAKSKIGEDVSFEMVEMVRGENATFGKGTPVEGRIVNVQKFSPENGVSEISVFFDFIKDSDKFLLLKAGIISMENNTNQINFSASPTFEGGTVLSLKNKDFQLNEGDVLRVKVLSDVIEN